MVITCQQCSARLQLDDTKVPARSFTVRCPKCEHVINAQPPATLNEQGTPNSRELPITANSRFERPRPAPAYKPEEGAEADSSSDGLTADKDEVTELLAAVLQRAMSTAATAASNTKLRRPFACRRALICAEPEHRFAVARVLVENGYEAFVAQDTTQAIERMREDQMDVIILSPHFDTQEQGAAFIRREISTLRPAARRRLFFVHLSTDGRNADPHMAFIQHANLLVNPGEIDEMPYVLERAMRNFNELYRNFNKAVQAAEL